MKRIFFFSISLSVFLSCSHSPENNKTLNEKVEPIDEKEQQSSRPVNWGYSKDDGPSQWSKLSSKYMLCGEGEHQSPINIINLEKNLGI